MPRISEILREFLRLGLTAFGGPAAHFVAMERAFVDRLKWLSREQFLDLIGACNLLPGPGSTQVAMALGFRRGGWLGLVSAGICFILPASLATLTLAWGYVRYGSLPIGTGLFYGIRPVMVAILVQAVWNLGHIAFRRWPMALTGLACFGAALLHVPPLAVLLAGGTLWLLAAWVRHPSRDVRGTTYPSWTMGAMGLGQTTTGAGLVPVLLTFLKLGVVVFGSGYVLVVFLKADLVDRLHWITESQLLDAITAGQVTPGPVFATATFLGYLVHGGSGAAVATAGIFLPSFLMAGAVGALAGRIRKSRFAGAFLDGVNAAAVALMASVAILFSRESLIDGWAWGIGVVSALLLVRFKVNATWLILGAAVLGIVVHGHA